MSKAKPRTIEVEIYDQKQAKTPDSLKVAILTALHLAQEFRELRQRCDEKTGEFARALDAVLK